MCNGCFFLWASISNYVLSYLYIFDKSINTDAIFYVDLGLVLWNCMGYQLGVYLLQQKKWNPKCIIALGGGISLVGIFASSYSTDLISFIFLYGGMSGIGSGMTYMLPMVCGLEYFPENKGLITGIIIGSYGAGSFFFIQIAK